jgi:hypothetical protein
MKIGCLNFDPHFLWVESKEKSFLSTVVPILV